MDRRVEFTWRMLKIVFGVVPIVAGLDKFVGLLASWETYLSPLARSLLPISPGAFMRAVGVIEIVAGLIVLSRYTRVGATIVSVWLVLIALQLISSGRFLDVAVRDLVMAISAFGLARLSEVHDAARAPAAVGRSPAGGTVPARA